MFHCEYGQTSMARAKSVTGKLTQHQQQIGYDEMEEKNNKMIEKTVVGI